MIPLKDNVLAGGRPTVTLALIAVCLVGFGWQLAHSGAEDSGSAEALASGATSERDELALAYGTSPERIADGESEVGWDDEPAGWLTPLTAIPLAPDLLRLAVGLLFLLIFGRTVEARIGGVGLLALALAGAFAGAGLLGAVAPDESGLSLGIGTALCAVLGAYAVLHPRAGVLSLTLIPLFSTLVEVPALALIAAWFLIALLPAVAPMLDPHLLLDGGLQIAGFAAAFAVGAVGAAFMRGRPVSETSPAS